MTRAAAGWPLGEGDDSRSRWGRPAQRSESGGSNFNSHILPDLSAQHQSNQIHCKLRFAAAWIPSDLRNSIAVGNDLSCPRLPLWDYIQTDHKKAQCCRIARTFSVEEVFPLAHNPLLLQRVPESTISVIFSEPFIHSNNASCHYHSDDSPSIRIYSPDHTCRLPGDCTRAPRSASKAGKCHCLHSATQARTIFERNNLVGHICNSQRNSQRWPYDRSRHSIHGSGLQDRHLLAAEQ